MSPVSKPGMSSPELTPAGACSRLGLVLTGGGARAAYQVGVMKAVAELEPREAPSPFRIIAGTSAGAIVATGIATHAARFREGARALERIWRNFHTDQVFRADAISMLRTGMRWAAAVVSIGRFTSPPDSLFDNSPLRRLLARHVDWPGLREAIARGHLDALAISAAGYHSARSTVFYESTRQEAGLHRWPTGAPATLDLDHLMASTAIPFLFPPVYIGNEPFGDGGLRQISPLTPAIRLGADRLFIVGVRPDQRSATRPPTVGQVMGFAQIAGFMLEILFMDSLHTGLVQLNRLNQLVSHSFVPNPAGVRYIDYLAVIPQCDFSELATAHAKRMPRTVRALLGVMGAGKTGASEFMSYLLFESGYTRELIALGYEDALRRRDEIAAFLHPGPRARRAGDVVDDQTPPTWQPVLAAS